MGASGSHCVPHRFQAARAFTRLDDLAKEEAAAIAATPLGQRRRQGYVPKKHGAAPARREVLVSGKSWDGPKAGFGEQCLAIPRQHKTKRVFLLIGYGEYSMFLHVFSFLQPNVQRLVSPRCVVVEPGLMCEVLRRDRGWLLASRLGDVEAIARCVAMNRSEASGVNLEIKSNTERLSA